MKHDNDLKNQFERSLDRIGLCPYCGDRVRLEPTDLCCGEVHGELGYSSDDLETYFLESEYEEHFQKWLKIKEYK